jgi:hypothetical protein
MNSIVFDTYRMINSLKAKGMPEEQAEAVVNVVRDAQESGSDGFATKADIAAVRSDMEIMKRDITIRMGTMIVALGGFLVAVKYLG